MSYWSKDQVTKEQAMFIAKTKLYKEWSSEQVVSFQLFQKRLAMPFSYFHKCLEEVVGQPLQTAFIQGEGRERLQKDFIDAGLPVMGKDFWIHYADKELALPIIMSRFCEVTTYES